MNNNKGDARMNSAKRSTGLKFLREESGQALPWISLTMVLMIGMTGFVVDMGRAMVVNNRLQAGTEAAALAGANDLPNNNFSNIANGYGSSANNDNYSSMMPNVVTNAVGYCSNFVTNTLGIDCVQTSTGSAKVNALVVTQTVTMPTTFIRLLGIPSISFSSTATAAWKGAARYPYNVAVVIDTTASMKDSDGGSIAPCSSETRVVCSMYGIEQFLVNLTPCSVNAGCGTLSTGTSDALGTNFGLSNTNNSGVSGSNGAHYGIYANSLDEVALYTFPGFSSTTGPHDDATGKSITVSGYEYVDSSSTTAPSKLYPMAPYYQVVGFSSDFMTQDGAGSLNSSSELISAVGTENGNGKLSANGGAGTYYAGVVYRAQYDLAQQYAARLNAGERTSNVMVILSDGDASHSNAYEEMGGNSTSTEDKYTATGGAYGSVLDECQQAINAAQAASNGTYPSTTYNGTAVPKTTIYTVSYGSESDGCDDASINSSGTLSGNEGLEPCDTMQQMASSWVTDPDNQSLDFYSDYSGGGGSGTCVSDSHPTSSIQAIFQEIAGTLSASKIIQTASGCSASNTAACN